jgi:predicted component of type VI protein secretion system
MQLSLVVVRGNNAGQIIPIQGAEFCIGRDETCELWAPNMTVSRRHTAILVHKDRVLIRDLGSRNGTFVNGIVVVGDIEVGHDDRLRVGPFEFRIQLQLDPRAGCASGLASTSTHSLDDAEAATGKHCPLPSSQGSPAQDASSFSRFSLEKSGLLNQYQSRP